MEEWQGKGGRATRGLWTFWFVSFLLVDMSLDADDVANMARDGARSWRRMDGGVVPIHGGLWRGSGFWSKS